MKNNKKTSFVVTLLGGTALGLTLSSVGVAQQVGGAGFVFSIDGETVAGDPQLEDRIRRTDIQLAQANVQVTFDGIDPTPRLNVEIANGRRSYGAGDTVRLRSETNYPAFIERGEMRLFDRNAAGGTRLIATVPVTANGVVDVTLPAANDLVVVHRVYDTNGRFDETEALSLSQPDDRRLTSNEDGADFTAQRNIRVNGGTVTVAATSVAPGATLYTLGEAVRGDAAGRLVLQRILPAGEYDVDVSVRGAGQNTELSRPVTVPSADWFYVVVGDLTYGAYRSQGSDWETRSTGRLQFYVDGETVSGVNITSSLDTGEGELDEIFSRLDEKDPRSVLGRLDPQDSFPTFGDDSESVDTTPTSGRFYLLVEQDGNFALWGDYKADIAGSGFLRNERTLYGAQAEYRTQDTTPEGEARATLQVYAAQPDQLAGREVFQGTGGSVYFLQRSDLTIGSETLTVELRDADTGRVIERRNLVEGRDYDINYIQGIITLNTALTSTLNPNLIQTNPGGDVDVNLVAQYEYTPLTSDVDGFAIGGRAEVWATDNVRLGLTVTNDDTGVAENKAVAVDLRYEFGQNSFVQLDYAESDGPGLDTSFSRDGGLIIDNAVGTAGTGTAFKVEGQADLTDLGFASQGVIGGYFEQREEGFSTLDQQVTATTGDETLYGVFAQVKQSETLAYKIYADAYENGVGHDKTEVGAEVSGALTDRWGYTLAAEYLDETTASTSGTRTDVAGRVTYSPREGLTFGVFGQVTASTEGLDEYDRYGVSVLSDLGGGWTAEAEVSDGTGGVGGRALIAYADDANNSSYFGYELDAGRAIDEGISRGDNGGKYVLGGRRQVNGDVAVTAENTYDIFGSSRSLTGAYGVEYQRSDFLTYTAALEVGQIEDDINGDFDRRALSFGVRYEDEDTTARGRVEVRRDNTTDGSTREDVDAIYVVTDLRYKIDETQRLIVNIDAAQTQADTDNSLAGDVIDASLGYAYRPIDNERLNVLTRYRYFYDSFGQSIDGVIGAGPIQESSVISIEGSYDVTREWTIGAKLGGRSTRSAATPEASLTNNDAWLAIVNARYNLVHEWDVLVEARMFEAVDAGFTETGALVAAYRQFGENAQVGVGYNFGNFSDDLTDLTFDDEGVFINLVAKF